MKYFFLVLMLVWKKIFGEVIFIFIFDTLAAFYVKRLVLIKNLGKILFVLVDVVKH